MNKERKAPRGRREQLLTLFNGWDPAGLLEAGAPRDEYDRVVDKLLALLASHATKEDVAKFLEREIRAHFNADAPDAPKFAAKAVTWYAMLPPEEA